MYTTKEAYFEKITGQINEWRAEFDKLKAKGEQTSGDAKLRYSKKIEELEHKIGEAEQQIDEIQQMGEERVREFADKMESSWNDISKRFSEIRETSNHSQVN
jgi:uncharacterized coiled-coil protein SlyX